MCIGVIEYIAQKKLLCVNLLWEGIVECSHVVSAAVSSQSIMIFFIYGGVLVFFFFQSGHSLFSNIGTHSLLDCSVKQ